MTQTDGSQLDRSIGDATLRTASSAALIARMIFEATRRSSFDPSQAAHRQPRPQRLIRRTAFPVPPVGCD